MALGLIREATGLHMASLPWGWASPGVHDGGPGQELLQEGGRGQMLPPQVRWAQLVPGLSEDRRL